MTAAAEVLARLHALGIELEPIFPDGIRWRASEPLSDEARALLAELQDRKREAWMLLAGSPAWDDDVERIRLRVSYDAIDREASRVGTSWAAAWSLAGRDRPDLVHELDDALDEINRAWRAKSPTLHMHACTLLRCVVWPDRGGDNGARAPPAGRRHRG